MKTKKKQDIFALYTIIRLWLHFLLPTVCRFTLLVHNMGSQFNELFLCERESLAERLQNRLKALWVTWTTCSNEAVSKRLTNRNIYFYLQLREEIRKRKRRNQINVIKIKSKLNETHSNGSECVKWTIKRSLFAFIYIYLCWADK